jgi:hypothetical protein
MNEAQRARRNLYPHKDAIAAMWLFGSDYAKTGMGSMDFYDQLSKSEKNSCQALVKAIDRKTEQRNASNRSRERTRGFD